ncbi:uncharacterized protein N7484_009637 [Penicillium longicatenatum]|uniref:uncharacterized protein n=1 Tax=Penicillium longicatenatum TaxID=1561947 RepID=UPI002548D3EE|nr:uncharacterized protein N7484_009637 [Penicillium longicatenatum]KAJ5636324.1 hypothetical protein N7484_009637 [Penicillium longicatenatum]
MSGSDRQVDAEANAEAVPAIAPDASGPANDGNTAKSRRRRRPASAENQAKNQMFYFVDSSSSSKEKRAHVMRHHVQEKRKQRKMSHGTMPSEQIQELTSWQAREDSTSSTDNKKDVSSASAGSSAEQDSSVHYIQLPIRFSAIKPYAQPMPMQLVPPMTIDTSRRDPFSSPSFTQNPEDAELAEYWTSKLTYWSGQNPYVKDQMFRTAMGHPVSFQAVILTYCARFKAQILETPDTEEVQRHVGQARKNIQDATAGSLPVNEDYLAMALAGMALGEDRFGSKQDAQAYLEQAARIMRPRTGINRSVEAFLHYVRLILPPPPTTMVDPTAPHWLVAFLRAAEDIMHQHSAPEYLAKAPQRRDVFQMECPLFSLLSSGPRPSQVPHASRMYVVRDPQTQEVSRTAALIYITAALWDFKDSIDKTVRFLIYLNSLVAQHQLDRHPACETLLWLLLEQGCEPDLRNPERAWSAGDMIKSHRKLRPDLQFHFNEILMSFLTLRPPIRGIDKFQDDLLMETSSNAQ